MPNNNLINLIKLAIENPRSFSISKDLANELRDIANQITQLADALDFSSNNSGATLSSIRREALGAPRRTTQPPSAKLVEEIVEKSAHIMKRMGGPVYAKQMVKPLKDANVDLPEDAFIATARISAIYAKRPDIFKKIPGAGQKATSQWEIKR